MVLATKALAVWLVILVAAIANGSLREAILIPQLGKAPGLLLSGLMLATLILAVAYVALPWLEVRKRAHLVGIGLGWLLLTIAFELAFGWAQGKSWSDLLAAYTFKDGNVWPLVLTTTMAAPYLAGRLRGLP